MKFHIRRTLPNDFKGVIVGYDKTIVSYAANLENAERDCLTFCTEERIPFIDQVEAGIILCPSEKKELIKKYRASTLVFTENPVFDFVSFLYENHYSNEPTGNACNEFGELIERTNGLYIEKDVLLGINPKIYPFVSVFSGTRIGDNCRIQAGSSVGSIGLAYARKGNEFIPFPHLGGVIVGDRVEIGSNVSIVKGILQNTIIDEGTKIGNNVNIGHNVHVGRDCFISAGAILCGSVNLADNVWVAPGACIRNHVKVAAGAVIGMGAVVIKDVPCNATVVGNPAKNLR